MAVAAMAFMASNAFAAHSGQVWQIEGSSPFTNGQSETVSGKASTNFVFTSEAGGKKLKITATAVECVSCTISQDIVSEAATATDSGKLRFTGITVNEPTGCSASAIETKALTSKLVPVAGLTSGLSDEFKPTEGEIFAPIVITGCSIAETYNVKGSVCAETEKLGVFLIEQPLRFSSAINTKCGKALTLGTKAATLEGTGLNKLTGTAGLGKKWGATTF